MPGKLWTAEEEIKLKEMVDACESLELIASVLGRSKGAVREKCGRLGLRVVVGKSRQGTTSTMQLPEELPSVEEALRILAGALNAASEPGLDRVEVQRLQVVATLARTYKNLLTDYIGYRQIEAKLVELEAKYARLAERARGEEAEGDASE